MIVRKEKSFQRTVPFVVLEHKPSSGIALFIVTEKKLAKRTFPYILLEQNIARGGVLLIVLEQKSDHSIVPFHSSGTKTSSGAVL